MVERFQKHTLEIWTLLMQAPAYFGKPMTYWTTQLCAPFTSRKKWGLNVTATLFFILFVSEPLRPKPRQHHSNRHFQAILT